MEYKELVSVFEKLYKYCNTQKQVNTLTSKIYAALKSQSSKRRYELVGLSMMCYRLGKENKTDLGDNQLRGRIGKLLYCL